MNKNTTLITGILLLALASGLSAQHWGRYSGWESQSSGYKEDCYWGCEGDLECRGDGCQWVDVYMNPCESEGTECSDDDWDEVVGETQPCTENCDCDVST